MRLPLRILSAQLFALPWCAPVHAEQPAAPVASVREAAMGSDASLASPSNGESVLDPQAQDDAFLEESLLFEMAQQRDWQLRVFASGVWRYDSNVFLSEFDKQSDLMWSVRPGFQYAYGDEQAKLRFQADYSIQANWFEKFKSQDSINHYGSISARYQAKKTTVTLSAQATKVSGGDVDVGGQAQRLNIVPKLIISYEATEKIKLGLTAEMEKTEYDSLLSATTYRVGPSIAYAFTPRLNLGLKVNQVVQDVDASGRHQAQDYLLSAEWESLKKVFINGSIGVQHLRPAQGGGDVLPLASLGVRYEVGPKTSVNLNLHARSQSSPSLTGQYFQSNGVVLGLQQQIGSKLNIGADIGYDMSEYRSYEAGELDNGRQDNLIFVRPWLKYSLFRHWSLDVFYQYTVNDSSGDDAKSFERSLFGVGVTCSW